MPGKSRYTDTDFSDIIRLKYTLRLKQKVIAERKGMTDGNVTYHLKRLKKDPEWATRIELAKENV